MKSARGAPDISLGKLSRYDDKLEIFITEGRASANWFWYLKDKAGRIIKRCRPGGCDTYYMATQEAIDEYNLQSKGV